MVRYSQINKCNTSHTQKKGFLEVINEFSKVSGHKIKIQKSIVVLHTINEKLKTDI